MQQNVYFGQYGLIGYLGVSEKFYFYLNMKNGNVM